MKTISTLFFAGMLMSALCVAFVACNEPKETEQSSIENEIQAVSVSNEVSDFFDNHSNLSALGKIIFREIDENGVVKITPTERCITLNSANELPKVDLDGNPFEFPDIDFDSQTLILGVLGDIGGDYVASKSLVVKHGVATIDIVIGKVNSDDFYAAMTLPCYFWGIYPKIEAETIDTNVTREN